MSAYLAACNHIIIVSTFALEEKTHKITIKMDVLTGE